MHIKWEFYFVYDIRLYTQRTHFNAQIRIQMCSTFNICFSISETNPVIIIAVYDVNVDVSNKMQLHSSFFVFFFCFDAIEIVRKVKELSCSTAYILQWLGVAQCTQCTLLNWIHFKFKWTLWNDVVFPCFYDSKHKIEYSFLFVKEFWLLVCHCSRLGSQTWPFYSCNSH